MFPSCRAQYGYNHCHKNACGYSLAANIPDHYGHAISIEREEVKEIASDLTSWPNFGADLKVGLGEVHRRLLRKEGLLNQGGAGHFSLLPLLAKDLLSETAKCCGELGELRGGVCQVLREKQGDVVCAVLGLDLDLTEPLGEVEHGCVGLQDLGHEPAHAPIHCEFLEALLKRRT